MTIPKRTLMLVGAVLVVLTAVAALRFFSGDEDAWLCRDGVWVAHGKPSSPRPLGACGPAVSGSPRVCTMEAKLCPDGSSVGRIGPNCEFAACPEDDATTRTVSLYFYEPAKDSDETGNINCTAAGLTGVSRSIPLTTTPIQDVVRLLIQGELTPAERAQGLTTEFPFPGLTLTGASLKDGTLTLSFIDRDHATSGGSCRANILRSQVEATAMQFGGVSVVRYLPEDALFQP